MKLKRFNDYINEGVNINNLLSRYDNEGVNVEASNSEDFLQNLHDSVFKSSGQFNHKIKVLANRFKNVDIELYFGTHKGQRGWFLSPHYVDRVENTIIANFYDGYLEYDDYDTTPSLILMFKAGRKNIQVKNFFYIGESLHEHYYYDDGYEDEQYQDAWYQEGYDDFDLSDGVLDDEDDFYDNGFDGRFEFDVDYEDGDVDHFDDYGVEDDFDEPYDSFYESFSQEDYAKLFNKLKIKDEILLTYKDGIGDIYSKKLIVTRNARTVGKEKLQRITLINPDNPKGMKHYFKKFASGDYSIDIGGSYGNKVEDITLESIKTGHQYEVVGVRILNDNDTFYKSLKC